MSELKGESFAREILKEQSGAEFILSGLKEGYGIQTIDLKNLMDHPKFLDHLLGEVMKRDCFSVKFSDGSIVCVESFGIGTGDQNPYANPSDYGQRVRFFDSEADMNDCFKLLDEKRVLYSNKSGEVKREEIEMVEKKLEKYTTPEHLKIFDKSFEDARKEIGKLGKQAVDFVGYTVGGRKISVKDGSTTIDFGEEGSQGFATGVLGVPAYGSDENFQKVAQASGLSESLSAIKMIKIDECGEGVPTKVRVWKKDR